MKTRIQWTEKMAFRGGTDAHQITMDTKSPLGSDSALTPKELLTMSVAGCTGMDVIALLRKFKQPVESFDVEAEANLTEGGYPAVFKDFVVNFYLTGAIDSDKALEAVRLSQTKYCGVSAMLAKAVAIQYNVYLNQQLIGSGTADFPNTSVGGQ